MLGRTRYAKNCLTRFETFTSHLAENPLWQTFFLDKGVGAPPVTYLADIEEGLRNYVDDPFTMGRDAMSSQAKWAAVEPWRKRETYITLIRHVLKRESYRKWHDFRFTDLVERNNLHHTFKNRHLPLSDGDASHFGGLITNPPHALEWWTTRPPEATTGFTTGFEKKRENREKGSCPVDMYSQEIWPRIGDFGRFRCNRID